MNKSRNLRTEAMPGRLDCIEACQAASQAHWAISWEAFAALADAWRQQSAMRPASFTRATAFSPVRQVSHLICVSAAAYSCPVASSVFLRECRVIGRAVSDCIRLIGVIPRAGRPFLGTASGVFGIGGRVDCALAGIGGHDPEAPERIGRGVKEDFYLARRAAIVVGIGNFLILRIKDERPAIAGDAQHVAAGIVFYPFRQRNDRAGLPGQFLGEVSVLVDAAVMQLAVVADARRGSFFSRRQ